MPSQRVMLIGLVVLAGGVRVSVDLLRDGPVPTSFDVALGVVLFFPLFWLLVIRPAKLKLRGLSEPPVSTTEAFTAPAHVQEAAAAVERQLLDRGGRVERRADAGDAVALSAEVGSRLAFRLLGINSPAGQRHIPLRMEVDLRAAGSGATRVEVTASSNAEWYLFRVTGEDAVYRRALETLLSDVRAAVTSRSEPSG